jgi:predicted DsbA family dithiol-disulfide isomerase
VGALFHVGLNVDRFTLDVNNPSTARAVEADIKLAGELGVYAVPTLIIDRKWVVEGALQRFTLEMVFEQLVETGSADPGAWCKAFKTSRSENSLDMD